MKSLVLATLALASLPSLAQACSCMEPGGTFFVAPADGAAQVPTNARIWVGSGITRGLFPGEEQLPIELLDADGVAVPGLEGRIRSTMESVDVLTPDFLLSPNATYTVSVAGELHSTFSTGSASDDDVPAVPSETDRDSWSQPATPPLLGGGCGGGSASHGVSFSWSMGESVLIVLDNDGNAEVDVASITGEVPTMSVFGGASLGKGFGCGGDNWEEASPGARTWVRTGSFDLAGNFSGWSDEEEVTVRACDSTARTSPASATLLLLFGALLGLRRGAGAPARPRRASQG